MLTNKEIAITEIAEKSGFESLRSFHRAFQKFFNCTPTEYRKKVSNNSRSDKTTNLK
jgi:AraC-like DNA-binding protein